MVSLTYPARFMLAAAMNPCPCGYHGDSAHVCRCDPMSIERYLARISGPLLDRIDIHLAVPAVAYKDLAGTHVEEPVPRSGAGWRRRASGNGNGSRVSPGMYANAHMVGSRPPPVLSAE